MARFFAAAAFAATASAAALQRRGDSCGFQIQSSGGVDASMGQLEDGQNRLNGSYATATYYISNGGITDEAGRPCIVATTNDATHQFQCDLNSPGGPTLGFAIASNGSISFSGNDQFYACPYIYEYNVYTQWLKGQDKCRPIKLSTNSTCAAGSTFSTTGVASTGYASVAAAGYSAPPYPISSASVPAPAVSTPAGTIYSTPLASVYSTPEASIYSTPEASVYSTPMVSVETSSPIASVPSYETSTPIASVPAYSAQSSAPVESKPAGTTITVQTTISTSECETTSTATSSIPEVYSSIATSVPAYSAPTTYGTSVYVPASSRTASSASASSTCAAVGTTNSAGQYVCNPAHSYPTGQTCELQNGCYYLITSSSTSSVVESTAPVTSAVIESTTCTESTTAPSIFATSYPVAVNSTSTITPAPSSFAAASTTSPVAYSSSESTSAPSSTQTATSTTATACQTSLEGSYQTPHLITWVSSSHPDTAYGSQYNATIDSDCSTIFNFDIPSDYEGKTCSVIFLFPEQKDLETSAWSWNEEGSIEFSQLSSAASLTTTYDTCPSKESTLNTIAIAAGNSYVVSSGACQAGETISIEASSVNDLGLEFFEDWNPSSLGLYITAC